MSLMIGRMMAALYSTTTAETQIQCYKYPINQTEVEEYLIQSSKRDISVRLSPEKTNKNRNYCFNTIVGHDQFVLNTSKNPTTKNIEQKLNLKKKSNSIYNLQHQHYQIPSNYNKSFSKRFSLVHSCIFNNGGISGKYTHANGK